MESPSSLVSHVFFELDGNKCRKPWYVTEKSMVFPGFSMVFPWFSLQNPMGSHGQSPVKRRRSSAQSWPAQRTQPFGARRSATRRRTRRSIPGDIGSCEDTWRCLGRGVWEVWGHFMAFHSISYFQNWGFHPHFTHISSTNVIVFVFLEKYGVFIKKSMGKMFTEKPRNMEYQNGSYWRIGLTMTHCYFIRDFTNNSWNMYDSSLDINCLKNL